MAPLKVGIIGVGRIGRCHCASIASVPTKAKITMICDIFEPALKEVQGMYSIENITKDPYELINHPEVEAVVICSPTDQHADQIIACAKAGKYIFAEKPISLSLEIIDKVDKEVKATGVLCFVAFQRRFDPNFMRLKAAITNGDAGDLHMVHIVSRDPSPPPVAYIKVSGGLHNDMAVHDFDMARFLIGSEVTEVFCKGSCKHDPAIGEAGDIDSSLVVLTFENGCVATVDNSRKASYGYDQRVEVFGSGGMVQMGNMNGNTVVVSNDKAVSGDKPYSFFMDRYAQAYTNEMIAFVDCCRSGDKKTPVGVADGRAAYIIGKAAKQSMESGKAVKISDVSA
jgi:myo-inositol 2-dehydrogenase/D-chiro-inositol 1-dehydrogenase